MEHSANKNNDSQKPSEEHSNSQDHLAIDTTDDEQEDLPYDGILECYLVPSLQQEAIDKSSTPTDPHEALLSIEASQPNESPIQTTTNDEAIYSLDSSGLFSLSNTASSPITQTNVDKDQESEKLLSTIIPDVLLRHITEDNFLNPSDFIDFETMPEMSIFESSDETGISRRSDVMQHCLYDEELDFREEYLEIEKYRKEDDGIQEKTTNESNSDVDETFTKGSEEDNETDQTQENIEGDECPPDDVDEESKQPTYEPQRRPSYEMKYGQGQVHYKLPDFSKVPPKVKIPKGDNVGTGKASQPIKKASMSTNLSGQSFLIQDILDSMQPVQTIEDAAILDQWHEQVLGDSQFNCTINSVSQPASAYFPSNPWQFSVQNQSEVVNHGLPVNGLKISSSDEAVIEEPQNMECGRVQTEGEKMTRLLMEQAQTLKTKVESFSDSIYKKLLPRKEQLLVFHNLKSCLETLEVDYLSTKEKHRNLQLQIYRTGSQTIGEFDIEREVEGQIFRLGMLLEEIQEEINRSEENDPESAASTIDSLVLSPIQNEDVHELVPNNHTEKVTCTENQIQKDTSMGKEENDNLHPYLHPDTSAEIVDHGQDPVIDERCTVNSVNHLSSEKAHRISSDIVPLILCGQNSKGQNTFSEVEHPKKSILAEHSEFIQETRMARKLKNDIGKYPLHLRYQEDEMRKTQRKFRKPNNLSIFVQEGTLNLDLTNCNGTEDSLNADWLVPSHSDFFQRRIKSRRGESTDFYEAPPTAFWQKYSNRRAAPTERHRLLLSSATFIREFPGQKSLCPSKPRQCVQDQSSLCNRMRHIHSNISHYTPCSRSVSHRSHLAYSTASTIDRKKLENVKRNNLDYRENKILNYVLDNALRTAKNMQKTTERMVQRLATDLANPTCRSSYTL